MKKPTVTDTRVRNHVLRHLAVADPDTFRQLMDTLTPVSLHRGVDLTRAEDAHAVYFVESGVVSMLGQSKDGASVEGAIVGREGVVGFAELLGGDGVTPRLTVQLPGLAYRAPSAVVRDHVFSCRALHEPLLAFTQSIIAQLTQSVVCGRFHTSVQRLARWLLLTAERAETTTLPLTHEVLAQMVGAPRSAVTVAASTLRRAGLVDYTRGRIELRNIASLKKQACECYAVLALEPADEKHRRSRRPRRG
jgi:CRP-like cAMP-binding protein